MDGGDGPAFSRLLKKYKPEPEPEQDLETLLLRSIQAIEQKQSLQNITLPGVTFYGQRVEMLSAQYAVSGLHVHSLGKDLGNHVQRVLAEHLMGEIERNLVVTEVPASFNRDEKIFRARIFIAFDKA